jgi:hypothetical protein
MPPDLPEVAEIARGAILGTILQNQEIIYQIMKLETNLQ